MELLLIDKGDGGELSLSGGDLAQDDTLLTGLYVSLFNGDCFYNIYSEYKTDNSFFEAIQAPINMKNLKNAETAVVNLTKWMTDQGVAESIDASAYGGSENKINVDITVTEPNGESRQFGAIWRAERLFLKVM